MPQISHKRPDAYYVPHTGDMRPSPCLQELPVYFRWQTENIKHTRQPATDLMGTHGACGPQEDFQEEAERRDG